MISDERFRLVDEGNTIIVGLPGTMSTATLDLTPLLERLAGVEKAHASLVQRVASLEPYVDQHSADIVSLQGDVSADGRIITELSDRLDKAEDAATDLIGDDPQPWSDQDYCRGDLVTYHDYVFVAAADVVAGEQCPPGAERDERNDPPQPWQPLNLYYLARRIGALEGEGRHHRH